MTDATRELAVQSNARRCPYCHDQVEVDAAKVVCEDCLAVVHAECWSEGGACPSCAGGRRLVSESRPSESGSRDERGAGRVIRDPVDRRAWLEIREHPLFLAAESPDLLQTLTADVTKAWTGDMETLLSPTTARILGALVLIFTAVPVAAMLHPMGGILLSFAIGVGFVGLEFAEKEQIRDATDALDKHPTAAVVVAITDREPDDERPENAVLQLALDPGQDGIPDGARVLESKSGERQVELDAEAWLVDHLAKGDPVVLFSQKGRVVFLGKAEPKDSEPRARMRLGRTVPPPFDGGDDETSEPTREEQG